MGRKIFGSSCAEFLQSAIGSNARVGNAVHRTGNAHELVKASCLSCHRHLQRIQAVAMAHCIVKCSVTPSLQVYMPSAMAVASGMYAALKCCSCLAEISWSKGLAGKVATMSKMRPANCSGSTAVNAFTS